MGHRDDYNKSPLEVGSSKAGDDSAEHAHKGGADSLSPVSHSDELPGADSNQPPKRNLLALDGGGIRGYWTLLLLQNLMQKIGHLEEEDDGSGGTSDVFTSFHPHELDKNISHVENEGGNDRFSREEDEMNAGEPGEVAEARKIPTEQRYLPCHYFDYIGGSSTGALIAIMLGRLRMPVRDCIDEYEKLAGKVFGHPNHIYEMRFPLPFISGTKFSEKGLIQAVNDVIDRRRPKNVGPQGGLKFPFDEDLCKTFVTTLKTEADGETVALLRSYDHDKRSNSQQPTPLHSRAPTGSSAPKSYKTGFSDQPVPTKGPHRSETGLTTRSTARKSGATNRLPKRHINYGSATDWEVVQIARAATAAELYFPPVKVEEENARYSDGGFSDSNNPTMQGIDDIRERWGMHSLGIVVSVGTARHESLSQSKRWKIRGRVRKWTDRMTDPQPIHIRAKNESKDENFGFPYFRFTAKGDIALKIDLDEWKPRHRFRLSNSKPSGYKTTDEISDKFRRWLDNQYVQTKLTECAAELVEARRLRMKQEAEWERFAICAKYKCKVGGCEYVGDFSDKDTFSCHLEEKHPEVFEEATNQHPRLDEQLLREKVIRERRTQWMYKPKSK